ncbi:MAG: aminotransferase class I/II-fold pyridoxal phosphate-dependent enzyme [Oenococcus sicerae]|uniref:aminotransferase class I/II-fold pyridoxal phosphate-dependent enzyme n=1 Tax=Oenococcus sicerae TaxID=2203724 RepID=UPI0039EA7F66
MAAKHHVLIFADEIHNDISYPDLPTSSMLNDQVDHVFQQQTFVFKSATKAFNLAGAKVSFIFVKNEHYREILQNAIEQEQPVKCRYCLFGGQLGCCLRLFGEIFAKNKANENRICLPSLAGFS